MVAANPKGGEFLDYLLEGNYFDGKGIWASAQSETKALYEEIISLNPHLGCESPYGEHFRRTSDAIRLPAALYHHTIVDNRQRVSTRIG
jgi:hypothetical protein